MVAWRSFMIKPLRLMDTFVRDFEICNVFKHRDNKIWRVYEDHREVPVTGREYQEFLRRAEYIQIDFSIPAEDGFHGKYSVFYEVDYFLDFTAINTAERQVKEWFERHE